MPLGKRIRSYSKRKTAPYARRAKRARKLGRTGLAGIMRASVRPTVAQRVSNLYRMIETKESTRATAVNVSLPHNNVHLVQDSFGVDLNPFRMSQGAGDPMEAGNGNRIGDQISVKGVMIRGFIENALQRPRVYYRLMLLRGAKGETFNRANIFKGDAGNKMIDQVNTERFTIVAQSIFTINATNYQASTVSATGVPYSANNVGGDSPSGIATKTFKMWIPGYKFGRGGNVIYENGSASQVKFYDYRLCIVAYDWYGTPQDVNNVGKINELYCKTYFKDA